MSCHDSWCRYDDCYSLPIADLIALDFFSSLHIDLALYDFDIYRYFLCVRAFVLAMCILTMQRLGVCSLCLYSLDAPF